MSPPAPSFDNDTKKQPGNDRSSYLPESFWKPGKVITAGLALVAAVAGLIANVQGIADFMQPSLSSQWLLTETNAESSYKPYIGMTSTFQLFLLHDGHNLKGDGEKIQVDGKDIPIAQHQPITVTGDVSSGDVILKYVEKPGPNGAARTTTGEFSLKTIRSGMFSRQVARLEGSFWGTAAATSGTVVAIRKD
jgi:hypothetical protein